MRTIFSESTSGVVTPSPFRRHVRARGTEATAPEIAIVIPTLNERDNVGPLLAALDRVLPAATEIIFVDDWSSDGTADAVAAIARHRPDVRLIRRCGRRGLASAVIEGALSTTARVVAVIDADGQHDEAILPRLIQAVSRGDADVAIGSRYLATGSCAGWSASRAWGSRCATRLARLAVGRTVTDPLSGFFAIRHDLLVEAAPRLSPRGFKILLDLLASAGTPLRVEEVAYRFRLRRAGASKLGASVVFDYARLVLRKAGRRALGRSPSPAGRG